MCFIVGYSSTPCECSSLFATAFEQARTSDLAQKNSEADDLGKVLASSTSRNEASNIHSHRQEVTGNS